MCTNVVPSSKVVFGKVLFTVERVENFRNFPGVPFSFVLDDSISPSISFNFILVHSFNIIFISYDTDFWLGENHCTPFWNLWAWVYITADWAGVVCPHPCGYVYTPLEITGEVDDALEKASLPQSLHCRKNRFQQWFAKLIKRSRGKRSTSIFVFTQTILL